MTVRKIGLERTAASWPLAAALLAMGLVAPAAAQQADTPAPTPAPSSVFRLPPADDGRAPNVQGPADNGLPPLSPGEQRGAPSTPAPTPAPPPSAPRVVPTQPAPTTSPAGPVPAPRTAQPQPAPRAAPGTVAAPAPPLPAAPLPAAPITDGSALDLAPAAPADGVPDSAPIPSPQPIGDEVAAPSAPAGGGGTPVWAWALAVLAALGAGLWYWRRRPALAGDAPDEATEAVEAPRPAPRAATPPAPPAPPRPAPVAALTASPLVTRPAPEQRAMVTMTLDIRGIRMLPDRIEVAFTLSLINQGPVAATGLMVRIAAGQGSAMPEGVLARFFDGAGGSVLRDDLDLAPGASEQIGTEIMLPRASVEPLMIGGRPMLIPVMAFDVTYHWDGPGEAFGQNAGSFVIGRAGGAGDKLAPLPLDGLARAIERPGARATAVRRIQ